MSAAAAAKPAPFRCTLFPGDGIGPEIATAVIDVFKVSDPSILDS